MLHDCIYQFLRLFYHSRFKPPQLDMTMTQLATPVIDLVLICPLIQRLLQDFLSFSNDSKMKNKSKTGTQEYNFVVIWKGELSKSKNFGLKFSPSKKFLIFSSFFLPSMSCLPKSDCTIRLAVLYQAKTYRKFIRSEMKVRDQ